MRIIRNSPSKTLIFYFFIMVLSACSGPKEEIRPTWSAHKLGSVPFSVTYNIDETKVDGVGDDFRQLNNDKLGAVFQDLAGALAGIHLETEDGADKGDIKIDPIRIEVPELGDFDEESWKIVDSLFIRRVQLKITKARNFKEASLDIIKNISISIKFQNSIRKNFRPFRKTILSYSRRKNSSSLISDGKRINLAIRPINWIKMLKNYRTFIVKVRIKVDKAPRTDMTIGGEVRVGGALKTNY